MYRTTAQTVEKVLDFTFSGDDSGSGVGSYAPLDRFTVVGTSLWFTTSKGGTYDAGTIARLDLATTGRIASLMGALKIEHLGPQNQRFDYAEFAEQFRQQFGYAL